jgi:hypothetical protein
MSRPFDPYDPRSQELPPTPPYLSSAPPYNTSGPPYTAGLPVPYSPQLPAPYPPAPYTPPGYGYGVDPVTGQPYSDKSKMIAGLLQLLPGVLLGLGGIGRFYAGNVGLGVAQIIATVVGWISFWCGFVLILPLFIFAGVWLWFVVDGIVLLAGQPRDGQGRLLRP